MTRAEERTQKEVLAAIQTLTTGPGSSATAANQDEQTAYLETIDQDTGNIDTKLASTNTKLDTSNTNTGSIDTKLTSTNSKLDTVNANLDSLETKGDSTNTKLDTVNTKLEEVKTKQDTGNTSVGSLDTKAIADTLYVTGTIQTGSLNIEISTEGYGTVFAHIGTTKVIGAALSIPGVSFQGTIDGTNWFDVSGTDIRALDGQIPTTTSVAGIFAIPVAGFSKFRLSCGPTAQSDVIAMRAVKAAQIMNQIQAITFTSTTVTDSALPTGAATQATLEQIRLLLVDIKANQTNGTQVVTTT